LSTYDSQTPVCPFIFINAQFNLLAIYGLCDHFLLKNLWTFHQGDRDSSTSIKNGSINSNISTIIFRGVNASLLSPLVFEFTDSVSLTGTIRSIETDLIKSLNKVEILVISVVSMGNFFHKIGLEWTLYLPEGVCITFGELDATDSKFYTYPDRDLCIFSAFPFSRNIIAWPDSPLSVCTSTLQWLTQNYKNFNLTGIPNNTEIIYEICQNLSNDSILIDNQTILKKKVDLCRLFNESSGENMNMYSDYYEVEATLEFIDDLIAFLFIPLASLIGFILNLQTFRTIGKHQKKDLK
jgi:hypothetical protein